MTAVLEVANLGISFRQDGREMSAVRGVSFSVGKGETVALVGESGSGKSVSALSRRPDLSGHVAHAPILGIVTFEPRQWLGSKICMPHDHAFQFTARS